MEGERKSVRVGWTDKYKNTQLKIHKYKYTYKYKEGERKSVRVGGLDRRKECGVSNLFVSYRVTTVFVKGSPLEFVC